MYHLESSCRGGHSRQETEKHECMGRLTTDTSGMEGDIWGSLGDGVEGWSRVMDNGRVLDVLGVDELRRLMDDVVGG